MKSRAWHLARDAATRARQLAALSTRRFTREPAEKALVAFEASDIPLGFLEARGVPMTRPEVAYQLGLSVEGVRQIEERALAKVRAALGVRESEAA